MFLGLGLLGLSAGIAIRAAGATPKLGYLLIASGAVFLALRRGRVLPSLGLVLLGLGAGVVTAGLHSSSASTLKGLAGRVPLCSLQARVLEHAGALGTLLAVDSLRCPEVQLSNAGVVIVDEARSEPGSFVSTRGWLLPLGDDPYDAARGRAGAAAAWHAQEMHVIAPPNGLHAVVARHRGALRDGLGNLDGQESALALGLTIGDTSRLEHSTIDRFRSAGLSHILAVSGSNVALVLLAVGLLLRRTSQRFRLCACLGVLGLYVLVVGPDPSVLRAAMSAVVVIVAFAGGAKAHPLHALGIALLILLSIRPQLLFAAGLHLSVAATMGILLWTGPLGQHVRFLPRRIRLGAAATLAAQIGVAPVLIATFGEISVAGPLANLLALPAVPPATMSGLLAGSLALADSSLGHVAAWMARPFLRWILWVGETFGTPNWASVSLPRGWGLLAGIVLTPAVVAGVKRCTQMNREAGR
ncbi:MAG TPA: ComEC/Rec2 family competence protein [Actinomycetota bacterium]|nr:ComEC/Rec2 family competence protein [Actinomycetota bacterium]